MYVCVFACLYVYVSMYVCIYACMCVYYVCLCDYITARRLFRPFSPHTVPYPQTLSLLRPVMFPPCLPMSSPCTLCNYYSICVDPPRSPPSPIRMLRLFCFLILTHTIL